MAIIEITTVEELRTLHRIKVRELYALQAELRALRIEIKQAKENKRVK